MSVETLEKWEEINESRHCTRNQCCLRVIEAESNGCIGRSATGRNG